MQKTQVIRQGDIITVEIHALSGGGRAVGRVDRLAVFIAGALPGQTVSARITACKKRFAEAELLHVLTAAPNEIDPFCPHFQQCGGCAWQHMPYAEQLRWKQRIVTDALVRIGKYAAPETAPPLPSPRQYFFRNKMEFAFGQDHAGRLCLGLRARGSHQIVEVTQCRLQSERTMQVLKLVRQQARASGLAAWTPEKNSGFFRHLVIRETQSTRQCTVQLITAPGRPPCPAGAIFGKELGAELLNAGLGVSGYTHAAREDHAQLAKAERTLHSMGETHLVEHIGKNKFRLSPDAFFQTNTSATELLVRTVLEYARPTGIVWDMYCGVGLMGLSAADMADHVVGFELSPQAVQDARNNATLQGHDNATFFAGDLRHSMARHPADPHVAITDPPRAGMHPQVIKALLQRAPKRIVYVSCDPATLARDLAALDATYKLCQVQPVDMFPHSAHIETVALLTHR